MSRKPLAVLIFFLAACFPLQAAPFKVEIVELATPNPVAGAKIEIAQRQLTINAAGEQRILPLDQNIPLLETVSDQFGTIQADLPAGLIAVRVTKEGYAEHFDSLVNIDPKKGTSIQIELIHSAPSETETAILDSRRQDAQLRACAEIAQESFREPPLDKAAAQPVVPTDIRVVNLVINGTNYTGLINLDEFISGVCSREMGDGFPYEALKAQAVAARTFALGRLRDTGQANGGQAYTSTIGVRCKAATYNSSGVALTYNNSYITAFFSARCNGDFTLDSEDGLRNLATCEVGGLVGRMIPYLRKVPCSGHVNCSQTTEECCIVQADGRQQYIYGHGVGLCQRGAQQFADRDGWNWKQIYNRYYYTNVFTIEGNQISLGDRIELTATANRRPTPCNSSATSTTLGTRGTLIDGPSAPCLLGSIYYTWWRVALDNDARGWITEEFLRKIPIVQDDPTLNVGIALTATASPSTVQITANTRANLRVIFEQSTTLPATWTAISTNTANTNGVATLTTSTTPDQRHFRARIVLPDTLP